MTASESAAAPNVAVLDDYQGAAEGMADWSGRLPGARLRFFTEHCADPEELVARLEPFDVVVAMRERTPFPREVLERLPKLRLLVTTGMRNAAIDVEAARELGVTVCGTGGVAGSTAELTWALILGLVRGVAADDAAVRAGGWQTTVAGDLAGRTLGIVGLGRLGARVARVALAFDMSVVAWSPNLTQQRADRQMAEAGVAAPRDPDGDADPTRGAGGGPVRVVGKRELFESADIVSVHMVLSDSTRGLIGERELSAMRPDAYLVNTSRGPLIDDAALRRALEESWIAGAALDVFDVEPLPEDHWLRESPRALLSPHMGYVTYDTYEVFYGEAVEDIAAFLAGSPIRVL